MTSPRTGSNRTDRGASVSEEKALLEIAGYQIPYPDNDCQSSFSPSVYENGQSPDGAFARFLPLENDQNNRCGSHFTLLNDNAIDFVKNFSNWGLSS